MSFRRIVRTAAFLLWLAAGGSLSAQIITNVTPPLGGHGEFQYIKIFGGGFTPNGKLPNQLSVDFNGAVATTSPSAAVQDYEIDIASVPANATTGPIHVFINNAEAPQTPLFVVVPTNMPYATNFDPIYGGNGQAVKIFGVHFQLAGVSAVTFNGTPAGSFHLVSDNEIDVNAPNGVTTGPLILQGKIGSFSTATNLITNSVATATNFFVQPGIRTFSPSSGRPNTNVIIQGTNFTGIPMVQFGGVTSPFIIISNNTTILAVVPTNASSGVITIEPPSGTLLGQKSSTTKFLMLPTIYNFSPPMGPTNTTITITGAGLNEKSPHPDVTIGGTPVTSFGEITPNALSFNVPATAGSGVIVVTTTNGSITSSDVFYMPAVITSISPNTGSAGTIVKITGNSFTNASAVSFNGVPATFRVTNNTTIGAVAPPGVTSGTISVTTPFGTTNSADLFFVAPSIIGFTPTHGNAGTLVTITGTSFTNATAVSFNGTPATTFVVTDNSTINVFVPDGATTGPISVTGPGGTGTSATPFTIDSADVAVTISDAPDPVFITSNLVYTVTVTNSGPVDAPGVVLSNTLPSSVILKSVAVPLGVISDTNNNPIFFRLGTVSAAGSMNIGITVVPHAVGSITNVAFAGTGIIPDPNLANNVAMATTTVWPLAILSITNLMSNNLVQISWPAPLSGFTLQSNTNLSSAASWNNDGASKTINGTNVSVIETNAGDGRFFRLKQ